MTFDDIFPANRLPELTIFTFCDSSALNSGSLTENPFYHPHLDINRISCVVGGQTITRKLDFSSKKYIDSYLDFLQAVGENKVPHDLINYQTYSQGYCYFVVNFSPEREENLLPEQLTGSCSITIDFAKPLEQNTSLFFYSKIAQQISISNDRSVKITPELI